MCFVVSSLRCHLEQFTFENPKAQKYTLQAFEKLMELRPELMPKVVHLLKQMYDLDLIDEESFLEWDKKVKTKSSAPWYSSLEYSGSHKRYGQKLGIF